MRIATRYAVRAMTVDDIAQVMEVERESFPTMWPPTAFKRELQQNRLAHYIVVTESNPSAEPPAEPPAQAPNQSGTFERLFGEIRNLLGGEDEKQLPPLDQRPEVIAGFIGLWLLPDEAHIVTFGVRRDYRRRGIGELLLISAISLAQVKGQTMVTLECRVSNEAALGLYGKYGFEKVGLRPRYYSDDHEDAYVLTAEGVTTHKYQESFSARRTEHRRRWGDYDVQL
jgi:ribosomal-protein-alanine N-acetyltransferase